MISLQLGVDLVTCWDLYLQNRFVKVDIDESLEIAQQFNVSTVPTMIIFKDGKPVETLIGFMPKNKIEMQVKSYL